jgi:outer membrane protein assembly factor BamE (lipoprotein component of BamABCDE complex)
MNNKNLFIAAFFPVVMSLSGCVISVDGDGYDRDDTEKREYNNRQQIATLQLGMNLNNVMNKLGTPDFNEFMQRDQDNFQVLYYRTQRVVGDGMTTKDECTPVVLKNGALVGWGELALSKI